MQDKEWPLAKGYTIMLTTLQRCLYLIMLVSYAAVASEETVKKAMQKRYPDVSVESVARTPLPGIYEVFAGGGVFYVDENVNYLIMDGKLIDVERRVDVTAERMQVLTGIKFDQLPLNLAFRMVKGNGKRRMAYFTDPNCPYCKRLDQELARVTDVTVYMFLYPVLSPDSHEKAAAVWCSKDRGKAYEDMMLEGKLPRTPGTCDTPISKILAYGQQKGIRATPTLFFADGRRITGAISRDQLERFLDGAR